MAGDERAKFVDARNNSLEVKADAHGAIVSRIDAIGRVTTIERDADSNPTKTTRANGAIVRRTFDSKGNVLSITEAFNGARTSFAYDPFSLITSVTNANGHTTTIERDDKGNPTAIVNHLGHTTSMEYDSVGLIERILSANGGVSTFIYDAFGNINGKTRATNGITFTQTYSFADGDNVIAQTLPSGRNINLTRDSVRRIEAINADINGRSQSIISAITYRGDNQLTRATFGNGAVDSRIYDLQGRLLAQQLNGAVLIDERDYRYDKNSNITSILGSAEVNVYGNDPLDRITSDTIDTGIPIEFSCDLNDNRLTRNNEQLTIDATSNRLLKSDAIITDGSSSGFRDRAMVYNDTGRLFQLLEEGELKASYHYNDNGQRTSKTIHNPDSSMTTTLYHYDQFGQLVSETTEAGTPTRDYIWHDNGEVKAQIDITGGSDAIIYLHSDHLLTTRLATDQGQQVKWRWEGEVFGNTEPDEIGGVVVNLRFPGQYFDSETNLHYNLFRYYDPSVGRYITGDPIGLLAGLNTYGYVDSNPIIGFDPLGQAKKSGVIGDKFPRPGNIDQSGRQPMKGNPISEKFTPKQKISGKIIEKAIGRLLKKGLKGAADALLGLGPGAGTLIGKPVLVGVGSLLFSPRIGGVILRGFVKICCSSEFRYRLASVS